MRKVLDISERSLSKKSINDLIKEVLTELLGDEFSI